MGLVENADMENYKTLMTTQSRFKKCMPGKNWPLRESSASIS